MVKQDNPMLTDEEVKLIIPTMSQKLIAATQAGDYAVRTYFYYNIYNTILIIIFL